METSGADDLRVNDLLTKLEQAAREHDDQFAYRIEIEPRHRSMFKFVCETRDHKEHVLSGNGATIDEAISNAEEWCERALEEFYPAKE